MPINLTYDVVIHFNPKLLSEKKILDILYDVAWEMGGGYLSATKTTATFILPSMRKACSFRFIIRKELKLKISDIEIKGAYDINGNKWHRKR